MEKVIYKAKLPKTRAAKEFFNIELNEIDEAVYIAASSLVKAGKDLEATKLVLKELHSGGDNIEEVLESFPAVHSAMAIVLELLTPLESEFKKK